LAFMIPMMWLKDRRSFAITQKQFRDFNGGINLHPISSSFIQTTTSLLPST